MITKTIKITVKRQKAHTELARLYPWDELRIANKLSFCFLPPVPPKSFDRRSWGTLENLVVRNLRRNGYPYSCSRMRQRSLSSVHQRIADKQSLRHNGKIERSDIKKIASGVWASEAFAKSMDTELFCINCRERIQRNDTPLCWRTKNKGVNPCK